MTYACRFELSATLRPEVTVDAVRDAVAEFTSEVGPELTVGVADDPVSDGISSTRTPANCWSGSTSR